MRIELNRVQCLLVVFRRPSLIARLEVELDSKMQAIEILRNLVCEIKVNRKNAQLTNINQ
jgi:hypothetical protein